MPITLPNLDDRKYADLVEEARALIPTYAPEWTNHNPSDPGITLIELFAFLSELLIYRLNRVTDENVYAFLKLINGPNWKPAAQKSLTEQIRETMLLHREPSRAITCADFERLALAASKEEVARAHCVPRRNLELASGIDKPGHVSVVIVPKSDASNPQPDETLKQMVRDYLEPRRLLTTRVHVVGPRYFTIGIALKIVLTRDALEEIVRPQAIAALKTFLHPLKGGADGNGWPFGRDVYVSEIYELLDTLPGVDYVDKKDEADELTIDDPDSNRKIYKRSEIQTENGEIIEIIELVAIKIQPDELVNLPEEKIDLKIESPVREA